MAPSLPFTLVSASLLLGCNAVSGLNDYHKASEASAAEACEAYAKAATAVASQCGAIDDARYLANLLVRQRLVCLGRMSLPGTSLTATRLQGCTSAMNEGPCSSHPECQTVPGERAIGEPCEEGSQCQSTRCSIASGAVCGTCAAAGISGAPCAATVTTSCIVGAACTSSGVCATLSYGELDAPCDTVAKRCRAGLYCGPDNTCVSGVGSPCANSGQCSTDHYCDTFRADGSTPTKTCLPRAGVGEPCGAALCGRLAQCVSGNCVANHWVDPEGDCSAPGSTCTPGSCSSGTCPRVLVDGAACTGKTSDGVCAEGALCRAGRCTLPGGGSCG